MIDYRKIIRNREFRLSIINHLGFIPTIPYLKMVYKAKTGEKLNLENPRGFNEKLNWLKLHDIHPEYSEYVDKIAVRKIVEQRIGEGHTFPIIGVWDDFDEIDFNALPNQFVLKCTHDSGSTKIVRSKDEINMKEFRAFFSGKLRIDSYNAGREYPYKGVPRKIIAEQFMSDINGNVPNDYKFFCFDGEPQIMFVATDREKDVTHTLFDMDFNRLPIDYIHRQVDYELQKPCCFEEMKEISKKLSRGIKFVRVDLYELNKKVYFGEYTFFPAGGFYLMKPEKWERKYGDMINIGI